MKRNWICDCDVVRKEFEECNDCGMTRQVAVSNYLYWFWARTKRKKKKVLSDEERFALLKKP